MIHELLSTLADPTRGRMLLQLAEAELSVSELSAVLQLPQSTTSRHLKVLTDAGWLDARTDGTSHLYSIAHKLNGPAGRLWVTVRADLAQDPSAAGDTDRLQAVLADRHRQSQEFFATEAGRWDRLRDSLFGARSELLALAGFMDSTWMVGDLGCGTAALSVAIAPFVRRVIAVDESSPMLDAARARTSGIPNVELRQGQLEALPIENEALDAAVLGLVLPHAASPARVLAEAMRVLRPEGRLVIVDLAPHGRVEYRKTMGHVWQGFAEEEIARWCGEVGLSLQRYGKLPVDPAAKGPTLFLATARKPAAATLSP